MSDGMNAGRPNDDVEMSACLVALIKRLQRQLKRRDNTIKKLKKKLEII